MRVVRDYSVVFILYYFAVIVHLNIIVHNTLLCIILEELVRTLREDPGPIYCLIRLVLRIIRSSSSPALSGTLYIKVIAPSNKGQ